MFLVRFFVLCQMLSVCSMPYTNQASKNVKIGNRKLSPLTGIRNSTNKENEPWHPPHSTGASESQGSCLHTLSCCYRTRRERIPRTSRPCSPHILQALTRIPSPCHFQRWRGKLAAWRQSCSVCGITALCQVPATPCLW